MISALLYQMAWEERDEKAQEDIGSELEQARRRRQE